MSIIGRRVPSANWIRVVGLVMVSLIAAPAHAFNRDGVAPEDGSTIKDCGPTVYYEFKQGDFTSAQRSDIVEAIANWEGVLGKAGAKVVQIKKQTDNSQVPRVLIEKRNLVDANGVGQCVDRQGSNNYIWIDSGIVHQSAKLKGVATHEMGHVLGLAHVGPDENEPSGGEPPTMASSFCLTAQEANDRDTPSHDDHAALAQRQGPRDGDGNSDMNPNSSFEYANGKRFWSVDVGMATVDSDTADPPPGGSHLELSQSASYPQVPELAGTSSPSQEAVTGSGLSPLPSPWHKGAGSSASPRAPEAPPARIRPSAAQAGTSRLPRNPDEEAHPANSLPRFPQPPPS